MTRTTTKALKKGRNAHTGGVFLLLGTLFCLLLIVKNPEVAVSGVGKGLSLCVSSVIPSLFPFMVLSELAVSGDLISYLPPRLLAPMRRILGLSQEGCAAVLLGLLCGAPVGARCASLSVLRGEMQKKEAERVLACSTCPSSAFVIGALGVTLLHDRRLGVLIYLSALLAAFISGALFRLFGGDVATPCDFLPTRAQKGFSAALFTNAVSNATRSILLVSAYVVFFSALMGAVSAALSELCPSPEVSAILFCLLELSGGVGSATTLGNRTLAVLLSAFAVGWSGLSVHCQINALCDETHLSLRPYLLSKLLQGAICTILAYLAIVL